MALIVASMPPIPSPVINLTTNRELTLLVIDAESIPSAITTRQPRIMGRRPSLSATVPRITEPIDIPRSSMASTRPRPALEIPHSAAIPGAEKLMASTSKPSSAFNATHNTTAATCRRLIGKSSRIRCSFSPITFPGL